MKLGLKKIQKRFYLVIERFIKTCANLNFHGPGYVVKKNHHFLVKLIYITFYVYLWGVAIMIILRNYSNYNKNTIRFTTKTDYLNWSTSFPSVTICEMANPDRIWTITQYITEFEQSDQRYIGEVAFFSGTCYTCISNCEIRPETCPLNMNKLVTTLRASCESLFQSCFINRKRVDCCDHFLPVQTEYGICYSMNNKHADIQKKAIVSPYEIKLIQLDISQDFEGFVHSSEDIPFWNLEYDRKVSITYGTNAEVVFTTSEVVNEPEVALAPPEVRQCRFLEELPEDIKAFKYYSYSVCITECRIRAQIKLCNCTHHVSPKFYEEKYCDFEGLKCLTRNYDALRKIKIPDFNEIGLECECLPSCTEPDYNVVLKRLSDPQEEKTGGLLKLILNNRPYERVTRQLARTPLDLVVSVGNCIGLCFGGSLLSVVELFYYICFRKWRKSNKK